MFDFQAWIKSFRRYRRSIGISYYLVYGSGRGILKDLTARTSWQKVEKLYEKHLSEEIKARTGSRREKFVYFLEILSALGRLEKLRKISQVSTTELHTCCIQ